MTTYLFARTPRIQADPMIILNHDAGDALRDLRRRKPRLAARAPICHAPRVRAVRVSFVGAIVAALVIACASQSQDEPPPLEPTPTTKKPDSGAPKDAGVEATTTAPDAEPDASVASATYQGKLATTTKVSFGGPYMGSNYCTYEVTLTNVDAQLVLAGEGGDVRGMTVKCRMVEGTVPPCGQPPIPTNDHTYTLSAAKETANGFEIDLVPAVANAPPATLHVVLTRVADGFSAAMEWHRTGIGTPFDWRVKATVPVTRVQ